jgi:hypothetical protein
MAQQIVLTKGGIALIDDEDYERVSLHKWTLDSNGYAVRKVNRRKVLLHRFILDASPGFDVDHSNHNPLDNRRENLRICTRSQNSVNRGPKPGCTSRYKGVCWHRRSERWRAKLCVNGKFLYLGEFVDETKAAMAYDAAAYSVFGEFAYLNFPKLT